MITALISSYPELADWLWLIAAILFTVAAILTVDTRRRPDPTGGVLIPIGLAVAVVGWLVL
jgi:hypothetical protein